MLEELRISRIRTLFAPCFMMSFGLASQVQGVLNLEFSYYTATSFEAHAVVEALVSNRPEQRALQDEKGERYVPGVFYGR